jgi:hypothetical protein
MQKENSEKYFYDDIYRTLIKTKKLGAIKVGGSNHASSAFFSHYEFVLGFLSSSDVYSGLISGDYELSEVEIVCKVSIFRDDQGVLNWRVVDSYLGIEFPKPQHEYKMHMVVDAIEDNCGAHEILIIEKVGITKDIKGRLLINQGDVKINFDTRYLLDSPIRIVDKTLRILVRLMPNMKNATIFIATGGISDVFSLKAYDEIMVEYK